MKTDLRFAPSDAIETFPFPKEVEDLARFGEGYLKARREIMSADGIGLTKLYNRFHNPEDRDSRLERLRKMLCEIDVAVARIYGWTDLELSHDFHEVPFLGEKDRVRFTISELSLIHISEPTRPY